MKITRGSYFDFNYIKLCQEKAGLRHEYLFGYFFMVYLMNSSLHNNLTFNVFTLQFVSDEALTFISFILYLPLVNSHSIINKRK